MFMMHARHFVEEAERLVAEAEALGSEADGDSADDNDAEPAWLRILRERPRLIQRAALELRLGIEYAAYKMLHLRRKNYNPSMFKDWKANKIVEFIAVVLEENFDSDSTLSYAPSEEASDPRAWQVATHTKGVRKQDINRHYNALGHMLHVFDDSGQQFPKFDRLHDEQKALRKVKDVITYLRSFDGYGDSTFNNVVSKRCDCGQNISRPVQVLRVDNIVECPNVDCAKEWRVTVRDGEDVWSDATVGANCPSCGNLIPFRAADYADFKNKLTQRRRAFRAGEELTKNFVCQNPECCGSVDLLISYSCRAPSPASPA